jgi:hypothetical protein
METSVMKPSIDGIREMYKKPGGKFAKVTGLLAGCGVGYAFLKYALPFLVASTANLILFVGELVVLAVIVGIVTSKPFWRALSLLWLQVMRKLCGLVVNIDPIAILQNKIKDMYEKYDTVNENVTKLQAVIVKMRRKLDEYKSSFERNVHIRDAALAKLELETDEMERMKIMSQKQLADNEITRGDEQIAKQKSRIETSEKYLKIMKKLQVMVKFKVKDSENQVNYLKDDYEQARAQQSAMKSISAIMKGCLTTSMEEELAMDKVMTTVNTSIAEMERLIDGSNDILVNFELNSDANSIKAEQIVADFERNGFSIFGGTGEAVKPSMKAISAGQAESVEFTMVPEEEKSPIRIKGNYF